MKSTKDDGTPSGKRPIKRSAAHEKIQPDTSAGRRGSKPAKAKPFARVPKPRPNGPAKGNGAAGRAELERAQRDSEWLERQKRVERHKRSLKETRDKLVNGQADTSDGLIVDRDLFDVTYEKTEYLWPYRVPYSMLTLLCGRKGSMKGLFCMWLAAMIIRADGKVLWCEAEDPERQVLKPRAMAAGADKRGAIIVKKPKEFAKIKDLGKYIDERNIQLIIMSPCISFLKEAHDINSEKQVREELEEIAGIIETRRCAFICIAHPNKKSGGQLTMLERVMGAAAFVNVVRSVLFLQWDKEEDCPRLIHAAINLTSRDDDLLVRILDKNARLGDGNERGPFVTVELEEADNNVDADEALDRKKSDGEDSGGAQAWIMGELTRAGGELTTPQFKKLQEAAVPAIKPGTFRVARNRLVQKGIIEALGPDKKNPTSYRLAPSV